MKPFPLKRGGFSRYPTNKSDAIAGRKRRYDVDLGGACPCCTDYQALTSEGYQRFTVNDLCVLCSNMDSYDLYGVLVCKVGFDGETVAVTSRSYPDDAPRKLSEDAIKLYKVAVEALFTEEVRNTPLEFWPEPPLDAAKASESGVSCYIRRDPCTICGSPGVRTLAGDCHYCELRKGERSPRQKAIKAGKTWYTPVNPCGKCNTTAERHVFNGRCRGCNPEHSNDVYAVMMEASPTLVVSRDDARRHGFKVYRTGEECKRGHTGFRYVSSTDCIECKKGR